MGHQDLRRNATSHVQGALGFIDCVRARAGIGAREGKRRAPASAHEALGDRGVNAMKLEARIRQPRLEVGDGGGVVVIEVRAGGEQLDRFEAIRRDLQQMLPAEPLTVIETRRDAK